MMPSDFSRPSTKYWSTGAGFGKPVMPSKLMCFAASARHIASNDAPMRPAFFNVSAKALWPASLWSQSVVFAISCLTAWSFTTTTGELRVSLVSTSSFSCSDSSVSAFSASSASAGFSSVAGASGASSAVGSVSSSGTSAVNSSRT